MDKNNYPEYIERKFEFTIAAGQKPVRIDAFLAESLRHASRTKVQAAIDAGLVLMNGATVKHSRKIQPGDHIVCTIMKPPPMELVPENIPLQIHFEDEHLLVVHKPAGMVTHPGFGNRYGTLVNALLWHFGTRESIVVETPEAEEDEAEQNYDTLQDEIEEEDIEEEEEESSSPAHFYCSFASFCFTLVRISFFLVSSFPRVPNSPFVKSKIPTLKPASICLAMVPPQPNSASSG